LNSGEEVNIYYGKRTNARFLLHNGFIPELPNPDDLYDLKIGKIIAFSIVFYIQI
jgi:hypothetical protein